MCSIRAVLLYCLCDAGNRSCGIEVVTACFRSKRPIKELSVQTLTIFQYRNHVGCHCSVCHLFAIGKQIFILEYILEDYELLTPRFSPHLSSSAYRTQQKDGDSVTIKHSVEIISSSGKSYKGDIPVNQESK